MSNMRFSESNSVEWQEEKLAGYATAEVYMASQLLIWVCL